jgi:hypothetical protein
MGYVLALAVLIAIGFVVWRLAAASRSGPGAPRSAAPRGPDDDPDFLRRLNGPH